MKESAIERYFVNGIKKLGGMCLKFDSPGTAGVPDRIVLMPTGLIIFVELKTETGKLSKIQEFTIGQMRERRADVRVIKGLAEVKALLGKLGGDAQ